MDSARLHESQMVQPTDPHSTRPWGAGRDVGCSRVVVRSATCRAPPAMRPPAVQCFPLMVKARARPSTRRRSSRSRRRCRCFPRSGTPIMAPTGRLITSLVRDLGKPQRGPRAARRQRTRDPRLAVARRRDFHLPRNAGAAPCRALLCGKTSFVAAAPSAGAFRIFLNVGREWAGLARSLTPGC